RAQHLLPLLQALDRQDPASVSHRSHLTSTGAVSEKGGAASHLWSPPRRSVSRRWRRTPRGNGLAPLLLDQELTRGAAVLDTDSIVASHIQDAAERRAEEAIGRSEERFRKLAEHSSDPITLLDTAGRIIYSTPSLHPTLGYGPCEITGQSALELVHPDDR